MSSQYNNSYSSLSSCLAGQSEVNIANRLIPVATAVLPLAWVQTRCFLITCARLP